MNTPGFGAVTGGGAFGGLKDAILGKKDPGTPDEVIDLGSAQGRALQEKALGQYGEILNGGVQNQMAAQERQVRTGAEDQARKAQELVSQRGLGNSSVGIGAILNAHRDLGDKVGAIRASEPMFKLQNLQNVTQGVNSIMNEQGQSKIFKLGQQGGQRKGGLAPLLGAGAGAYFGGPQGAQAGASMGQMLTQMG
jgi:hypothetical protein